MLPIYEPHEDSFMLAEQVKKFAKGFVLDIGTGTGIQVLSALENKKVKRVIGFDISKKAIEYCKNKIKNKKVEFHISDLFEYFRKNFSLEKFFHRFDTITFNPPYLPSQLKIKDLTIEGGKKGYEVIQKFLSEVNDFLKPNGNILIVFSSLTKKETVDKFITENLLEYELLNKKHIFFEDIYVYLIKKTEILKCLGKLGIKDIKYFAKGKRGLIYQGVFKGKKVVIKIKRQSSKAEGKIKNEVNWLSKLNKIGIGSKLIFGNEDFFVSEFIEGEFILDYIKNNKRKNIKNVIKKIFEQLYKLDKLHVAKEEMHRPIKHIIVRNHAPVLIDFERAHYTKKPKNVTQFCAFLRRIENLLDEKEILVEKNKIIRLAKRYSGNPNPYNFNKLKNYYLK